MRTITAVGAMLYLSTCAFGVVVPGDYEFDSGTGGEQSIHDEVGRTYQMIIHSSLLTEIAGDLIVGLNFRLSSVIFNSWPDDPVSYDNYDIYLAEAVDPADRSATFADNVIGSMTQVRSGSLAIGPGSYSYGGDPNEFETPISITPWHYSGGNLLVEIRHSGNYYNGTRMDALTPSTSGYGTLFSAASALSYAGITGIEANFGVIELTTVVPSPAVLPILSGFLIAPRSRRRQQ